MNDLPIASHTMIDDSFLFRIVKSQQRIISYSIPFCKAGEIIHYDRSEMTFRADASADREEADGRIKRRKVSVFSELTRSSNRGENLLEKLREVADPYNHPYDTETNEDLQHWADLIDQHLS